MTVPPMILLVLLVALAGCGPADPQPVAPTPEPVASTSREDVPEAPPPAPVAEAVSEEQPPEEPQVEPLPAVIEIRRRDGQAAKLGFRTNAQETLSALQSWHPTYSAQAAPVKMALATYLEVRRGPRSQVQPACQTLLDATAALLADPEALAAPDRTAARALKTAYGHLHAAAQACLYDFQAEATFQVGDYQSAMAMAAQAMKPYGLIP